MEGKGFHYKEGWYFNRHENGKVSITKMDSATHTIIESCIVVDPDSWASAVASVSAFGETHETFNNVLAFHQGFSKALPLRKEVSTANIKVN